jgi:hypothetical protein
MRAALLLLALPIAACGGPEGEREDELREVAAGEATAIETQTTDSPGSESRSRRSSGEKLSLKYLQGIWCFAREGGGESGVILFNADGTYRIGIGGTPTDHYLEEPQDLEMFWQRNDVVEVEPDRFVALLSHSYPVIYVRAPC